MKKGGFTLIELLVVISIIGTLSSIVMSSINQARTKARDAEKNLIVNQYIKAIELSYDTRGFYPDDTADIVGKSSPWHCLGTPPSCGMMNSGAPSAEINGYIGAHLPQLKYHDPVPVNFFPIPYRGPVYYCSIRDGTTGECDQFAMHWLLEKVGTNCVAGADQFDNYGGGRVLCVYYFNP